MGGTTVGAGARFRQRQLALTANAITAAAIAALRLSARPGHRDFDEEVAFGLVIGGQALLLVADQQEAGLAIFGFEIILRRLEAGADQLARRPSAARRRTRPSARPRCPG